MGIQELGPEKLYHPCNPKELSFETTAELDTLEDISEAIGQPRAVDALHFGTGIQKTGYNIYALGPPGTGKHTLVQNILQKRAQEKEVPPDWCYVNNFEDSSKPRILSLPAGEGTNLSQKMKNLVEEAQNALKSAFESEEYQNRRQAIEQELKEAHQKAFEELQKKAQERGLTVLRTPSGIAFSVVKDGEILSGEQFQKLPEEEKQHIERNIQELQQESQSLFKKIPAWERQTREKIRELNQNVAKYAIEPLIEEIRNKYLDFPEVINYLNAVEQDIIDNVFIFFQSEGKQQQQQMYQQADLMGASSRDFDKDSATRRYLVNVLVDNGQQQAAPVVYENNPTYANLLGRVEHMPQMGALVTDFHLIKPGALHRANGGALILDAHKVLMQPGAWDGLKRALKAREIKIESLAQMFSLISTVSLEPQPVPLDVKVILIGNPLIYYLLKELDPEFAELFKVAADFDYQIPRDQQNQDLYARLINNVIHKEGLRHFSSKAVARIIEQSSRMIGDGEKLSAQLRSITDFLQEADYWAGQNGKEIVAAENVQKAIDAWTFRSDKLRERIHEEIQRGTILIDTQGAKVGQINGLSVYQLGEFMFGRPNKITARTHLGKGEVVDIEREVKLSGPIHSKGVLILSGFLAARYALDQPLSLSASLVFEQSYSGIEGDSASSAELYTLLSSIANIPIKQSMAVTGSVNQYGQIQAIGGVNEKIEAFFDICKERGLTGDQGVLIPSSNVKHLMLRNDVIEAVKSGKFHVHPVQTIEQGIEILTDYPAGEADENNLFPEGTVNGFVQKRLNEFAEKRRNFASESKQGGER